MHQWDRTESRNKHAHIWSTDFDKGTLTMKWGNGVWATIGAGTTGYPYTKEWTWVHAMHHI